MGIRIYLHPMCSSSARVFARLKGEGLLKDLRVISLDPGHAVMTDRLVPSVPALEVGGELVAVDPLEPEFVVAVLRGDEETAANYVPRDLGEAVERFTKSFIYSSYLMVLEYLTGNAVESAIRSGFATAAIRARFMGRDMAEEILESLAREVGAVREGVLEYLERVVAYNYLREALMIFGEEGYTAALNPETALLWLQAKASIGRAHLLPGTREVAGAVKKAERLVEVIREREGSWVPRLLKEFEELSRFAEELRDHARARSPY